MVANSDFRGFLKVLMNESYSLVFALRLSSFTTRIAFSPCFV